VSRPPDHPAIDLADRCAVIPEPRKPETRLFRRTGWVLGTLLALSSSACLGNVGQSSMESVTSEAFEIEATTQRTRIAAQNAETNLLGLIELSANRIIAATDDREVARNALRWKAGAIPVVQRAAHHPDALVSFVDGWILLVQMREYLDTGQGRDLFGDQQSMAVEPLTEMETRLATLIEETIGSTNYGTISQFVSNWAEANPIDNPLFVRLPVSSFVADALGEVRMGGVQAVGRLEELAFDAQQMAQSYLTYTPKVVLWQAQLLVEEMLDTASVGPLMSQVDRLELSMAATRLIDEFPELIRAERAATTAEVAALTEASLATLAGLASRERELVLAEVARLVRAERAALADDIAEALIRTMNEAGDEAIVVIDHTLERIAVMAGALIILLALIQYLLFRTLLARRRT